MFGLDTEVRDLPRATNSFRMEHQGRALHAHVEHEDRPKLPFPLAPEAAAWEGIMALPWFASPSSPCGRHWYEWDTGVARPVGIDMHVPHDFLGLPIPAGDYISDVPALQQRAKSRPYPRFPVVHALDVDLHFTMSLPHACGAYEPQGPAEALLSSLLAPFGGSAVGHGAVNSRR